MSLSVAFHIIGLVFWLGSMVLLTRVLTALLPVDGKVNPGVNVIDRLWKFYTIPGLVISLVTGIYQLLQKGIAFYMAQGWLHTKLTFVIILFVITLLTWREIGLVKSGATPSKAKLSAFHGVSALILLLVVIITEIGIR